MQPLGSDVDVHLCYAARKAMLFCLQGEPVMTRIALVLATIVSLLTVTPAAAQKQAVVEEGKLVRVRITQPVSSNGSRRTTKAVVDRDVVQNGKVLIRKGTPVKLKVYREKSEGWGAGGEVKIYARSTKAVDGTKIPLRGRIKEIGARNDEMLIVVIIGAILILPLLILGFFIEGEPAVVEEDTVLKARVDEETPIQLPVPQS